MRVTRVGILGAGVMGKQIALLCACHGLKVVVWEPSLRSDFSKQFRNLVLFESKCGNIKKGEEETLLSQIEYVDSLRLMASCDFLIEAIKENREVKIDVLSKLGSLIDESITISTNTSALSVSDLASVVPNPTRFIGVHFFNPTMAVKLVEVIKGKQTSDDIARNALEFLAFLGKYPVVLPDSPGFVVNRLLFPMINEAIWLLSEGLTDAATIDDCMKSGANHSLGPLRLADHIGLDVCLDILETLFARTGRENYLPAPLLREYVMSGKFGRKTGQGFYSYRK